MKRLTILAAAGALVATPALGTWAASASTDDNSSRDTSKVRVDDRSHHVRHGEPEPGDDRGGERHADRQREHQRHGADSADDGTAHQRHGADDARGHARHGEAEPGDDQGGRHGHGEAEPGDDHGGDDGRQHTGHDA